MVAERVALSSIKTLTLYAGEKTAARRTSPIQQLKCIGKACNLYQPDAVQCFNVGGTGTDVNWRCEADLPSALRFGRVDVSCEGWAHSGDPYVLKGSCGLEYRLVEIPRHLDQDGLKVPLGRSSWLPINWSMGDIMFALIWFIVFGVLLYSFLEPCFRRPTRGAGARNPRDGGGGSGGGRTGGHPNNYNPPPPPPPPYSKDDPSTINGANAGAGGWNPGFWTGLGVGGASAYFFNNLMRDRQQQPEPPRRAWDWERPRYAFDEPPVVPTPRRSWAADAGGEGGSRGSVSDLGEMRRATGVGGSSVR